MGSSSQSLGLPASIDVEEVTAHEAISGGETDGGLPVLANGVSEPTSGKVVSPCTGNLMAKDGSVDRFTNGETGMSVHEHVKEVTTDALTSSLLESEMMSFHERPTTSAELETRLSNSDCILTAVTCSLGPGSGEREMKVNKDGEPSREVPASTQSSLSKGNEEKSSFKRNDREAPPEFYTLRSDGEFRQHSVAKSIVNLKGFGQLQKSAPMDVPRQEPHHGQSAQSEYISYAHSMTEGVGRTLKGRDQQEFRNHVLRLTGFIED